MSDPITRYVLMSNELYEGEMFEDDAGDYVKHADHERIVNELRVDPAMPSDEWLKEAEDCLLRFCAAIDSGRRPDIKYRHKDLLDCLRRRIKEQE
jgi:hypothetical protein